MSPNGEWRLAPAYDVIWAWNPDGRWTSRHQMSINGKRDAITRDDLLAVAANVGVKKPGAIIDEVRAALAEWPRFAAVAGVAEEQAARVGGTFREFGGG
jgi:serine/threonine-protein kinase HipA